MNTFDAATRAVTVLRNASEAQLPVAVRYAELAKRYIKKSKLSEESKWLLLDNIDIELRAKQKLPPYSQGWYYENGRMTDLANVFGQGLSAGQYAGGLAANSCTR